jgi:hypothetical protein
VWRGESEGEAAKRRQWPGVTSTEEMRCSQARRAPFTHAEVETGATRRGFDVQRKTGGSGRSNRMASQQVEGTAKLQDLEVRAKLNRCVRECERKCFSSGWLDSIQQARACTRQQATREQVKSQGCVSREGLAVSRKTLGFAEKLV